MYNENNKIKFVEGRILMFLACTLEDVKKMISDCDAGTATIGILIADYRQSESKEYIINYLREFDRLSGKHIDFYIPGYKLKKEKDYSFLWHFFDTTIQDEFVEFDAQSFEQATHEVECILGVEYTYNPMLILVEIDKKSKSYFKSRIVIELDDNESHSVRRAGKLFREIFKIAKQDNSIRNISGKLEKMCLANSSHRIIEHLLQGDCITACGELSNVLRYRIKG